MTLTPQLLAAVAAVVAAVIAATLSALNLAVAGTREERKWRREALTEVLVTFTETTFQGTPGAAYSARRIGEEFQHYQQNAIDSHAVMVNSLTRLRMLARNRVVKKAVKIHDVQDRIYDAVFSDDALIPQDEFDRLIAARRRLRNDFLRLARRNLGLWGSANIDDTQAERGPSMRAFSPSVTVIRAQVVHEFPQGIELTARTGPQRAKRARTRTAARRA